MQALFFTIKLATRHTTKSWFLWLKIEDGRSQVHNYVMRGNVRQ